MEPYESSYLARPFLLDNYVYLLTPNSVQQARAQIAEEEARDARCSGLYEACDMAYVERKRETLASLRRKLSID